MCHSPTSDFDTGLAEVTGETKRSRRCQFVEARPLADRQGYWHRYPFYLVSPVVPQAVCDDLTESDSPAAAR
jgi:hypothetical protein